MIQEDKLNQEKAFSSLYPEEWENKEDFISGK
jgi:hypothetical protein